MKLPEYAKRVGVTRFTAHRWFHDGKIPGAYQLPSGLIYVPDTIFDTEKPKPKGLTVVYARVSSSEQRKTNLETQAEQLTQFAIANGWVVDKVIKEVGSGLNDERKKLTDLLRSDTKIDRIIVEHKDRLTRFGFNYLQILADKMGFEIIVVNPTMTDNEDLMQDFASIITSFCARLYSRRRAKLQAEKIIQSLRKEEPDATGGASSY
jgi:resolvase domain protein